MDIRGVTECFHCFCLSWPKNASDDTLKLTSDQSFTRRERSQHIHAYIKQHMLRDKVGQWGVKQFDLGSIVIKHYIRTGLIKMRHGLRIGCKPEILERDIIPYSVPASEARESTHCCCPKRQTPDRNAPPQKNLKRIPKLNTAAQFIRGKRAAVRSKSEVVSFMSEPSTL